MKKEWFSRDEVKVILRETVRLSMNESPENMKKAVNSVDKKKLKKRVDKEWGEKKTATFSPAEFAAYMSKGKVNESQSEIDAEIRKMQAASPRNHWNAQADAHHAEANKAEDANYHPEASVHRTLAKLAHAVGNAHHDVYVRSKYPSGRPKATKKMVAVAKGLEGTYNKLHKAVKGMSWHTGLDD